MLKDITIGQHFPGNSPVHNLDPRLKIVLTVAFVFVLFLSTNFVGLALLIWSHTVIFRGWKKISPPLVKW